MLQFIWSKTKKKQNTVICQFFSPNLKYICNRPCGWYGFIYHVFVKVWPEDHITTKISTLD